MKFRVTEEYTQELIAAGMATAAGKKKVWFWTSNALGAAGFGLGILYAFLSRPDLAAICIAFAVGILLYVNVIWKMIVRRQVQIPPVTEPGVTVSYTLSDNGIALHSEKGDKQIGWKELWRTTEDDRYLTFLMRDNKTVVLKKESLTEYQLNWLRNRTNKTK